MSQYEDTIDRFKRFNPNVAINPESLRKMIPPAKPYSMGLLKPGVDCYLCASEVGAFKRGKGRQAHLWVHVFCAQVRPILCTSFFANHWLQLLIVTISTPRSTLRCLIWHIPFCLRKAQFPLNLMGPLKDWWAWDHIFYGIMACLYEKHGCFVFTLILFPSCHPGPNHSRPLHLYVYPLSAVKGSLRNGGSTTLHSVLLCICTPLQCSWCPSSLFPEHFAFFPFTVFHLSSSSSHISVSVSGLLNHFALVLPPCPCIIISLVTYFHSLHVSWLLETQH